MEPIATTTVVSLLSKLPLVSLAISAPSKMHGGVYGYNDQYYDILGGACTPRDIWNKNNYVFSNPDAWLWDANGFN